MSEALAREAEALAAKAGQPGLARLAARAKMKLYRRKVAAYQACFCDEQGDVTEAGRQVLADLARIAGLGVAKPFRPAEQVQFDEGARRVALHLIEHLNLNDSTMARLARRLREADDE